jgi:ABC-type nickel/cobalt efflux system permease component RcnA
MPYRSFLAWNAVGAVIWSVVHVGVGAAVGASLGQAESTISAVSVVLVMVVAAVFVHQRHRARPALERAPVPAGAEHAGTDDAAPPAVGRGDAVLR